MGDSPEPEVRRSHSSDWNISLTFQVKFLLLVSHTHHSFNKYYKCLHQKSTHAESSSDQPEVIIHHQGERGRRELPEVEVWDWQGIPGLWKLVPVYYNISTACMLGTLIKTLFSEQLFQLAHLLTGFPGHCVIPGRFVFHPTFSGLAAFLFATFHINWRYVQYFKRSHMMSLFVFMLQSEHDLEQFYALMRANHRGDYLGTGTGNFQFLRNTKKLVVSNEEQFLRHILCYEVPLDCGRVVYRLRPNRKRDAHAHLIGHMKSAMIVGTCVLIIIALPMTIAIVLLLLSDLRYVQTYPHCSPSLDYLYTSGQLTNFWSSTFTWHHVVSVMFDYGENSIIWLDSGFAIIFVLIMTYLMNYDILIYWRHLHARIESNLVLVRAHHERQLAYQMSLRNTGKPTTRLSLQQLPISQRDSPDVRANQVPRLPARKSLGNHAGDMLSLEVRLLEAELNELQCELFDFFRQIERVDQFISDVLSTTVCIWLGSVAIPNYYYLARVSGSPLPPELRLVQLAGFLVISVATLRLLKLNQCCTKSYQLICSIMALDQSTGSTRDKFLQVIEFFTHRKATTYKLFQRIPYLATTYLKIIGYSFSSLVICNSLFGRQLITSNSSLSPFNSNTTKLEVMILGGSKYSAFSSSL